MSELQLRDPFQIPDELPEDSTRVVYAFELRKAGASYDLIAEKLGYASPESARQSLLNKIRKYFEAHESEMEEIVKLELLRLDELQLVCWKEAKDGNLKAVDQILKIMERRSKLLGLDKETHEPTTQYQTAVFIGGSEDEYLNALRNAGEAFKSNGHG